MKQIQQTMFLYVTLFVTLFWNLQIVVYLELMEVWGRENNGGVFLWLVSNIKLSVTTSYVMGKCRTDVFKSVFCDARVSMELPRDGECLRDNAVSLYFPEIPHFVLAEELKVFKNDVWNIYSASPELCISFIFKISYVQICTMFLL